MAVHAVISIIDNMFCHRFDRRCFGDRLEQGFGRWDGWMKG